MRPPTCYYAHCLALYGTPQETRDLELIEALGFRPVNPNTPTVQAACDALRANEGRAELIGAAKNLMYEIFRPLVLSADALAFRAVSGSGGITSGVVKEIGWAQTDGMPVFELPEGLLRRVMTLPETREHLREVGQR